MSRYERRTFDEEDEVWGPWKEVSKVYYDEIIRQFWFYKDMNWKTQLRERKE
jgi:hypothetical protein